MCRKVTRWGFRGVHVGEAAHPGPKKSFLRRCQSTRLDSDSDALLINRGRFAVLSSDDEEVCERSNHASSASVEILARAPVSSHTGPKWLRVMPWMSQATTVIGPSGEERAGLAISHNDSESDSVVDALQRDLEGHPVLAVNGDVGMSRSFHNVRSRIALSAEDCTSTVPDGDTQHVVAIPASGSAMDHRRVACGGTVERDRWRITGDNVPTTDLAVRRMEGGVEVFPLSDGSDGPGIVQESRSLLGERRSSVGSVDSRGDSEVDEDAAVEIPDTTEEAEVEIGGPRGAILTQSNVGKS